MLPGMDGYEVGGIPKENEATWEISVMFLPALLDEEDEAEGLSRDAVDYIRKPFNIPIVRARVKTHLDLTYHRDTLQRKTIELAALNARLEEELRERQKTDAMVQGHLEYLRQSIKEHASPSFPRNRVSGENYPG